MLVKAFAVNSAGLVLAAERRASAAPLAGVWSVEDREERQLPDNVRAADD